MLIQITLLQYIYSRPFSWTAHNRSCANSLCNTSIPLDALVCRVRVRFSRHHMGETGVSLQCESKKVSEVLCSRRLWGCTYVLHTSTAIATQHCKEYFGTGEIADSDSSPLELCYPRQQHQYMALRFPLSCAACTSQLWCGGNYT